MLRLPGTVCLGKDWGNSTNWIIVQMLDSTFLMTTEMMIDDLMFLLLMLAISLWILGNLMFHTMYE